MKTPPIFFVLIVFILSSCTHTSEQDLIDTTPITEIVTYRDNVKNIIDTNCISCHTNPPVNGAPMSLLTYENVKDAIENRGLIARISSDDLGFVMPFGGPKLPQNLIDIIIQWQEDGLLEE
ncbi:MAG: hypothetical protein GW839_12625 [Flavobacteriales bacterium]|nr:hypothetical protein [Flavobacteriia bacterium]NCP06289.1 hypothetical protein [Flavobacteriales bacterium]PIV95140.1 MAG: hypothetical protein COW44_00540 [Flavobacteriaceae bacterium CG17_big_fil_post_rev_8_21_14_2_50_33_15]PIY13403.1 MAG: hypothetical protein COZ17_00810 [Flavobacteriaceae bacterium CG_4_10_14_3_um_filter_33_47]PJB19730.1 MAG: hypothetical protein CO117_03655 [Flavobacteriaceae bacterium CG_4_9_14_3_um_filter_33_16]